MDIVERLNDHAEFADKVKRFADADCYRKAAAEISRLRAELEAARVDAERWRHARKLLTIDDIEGAQGAYESFGRLISEDECKRADAAIDAARGGK